MSVDVAATRESQRRRRLRRLAVILGIVGAWMWWRILRGDPVQFGWPRVGSDLAIWLPGILIVLLLGAVLVIPMVGNSRSPHQVYLPEQIEVGFSDVKGLGPVIDEVQRTLDVFLNHKRFQEEMGGSPRRGVLFEGPPGTGKTHVAKALAKEAGVPFLYVSSTAFQSMWYGMTGRRIKAFFRALRRTARREGGAIGFIEEIDAIGVKRGGVTGTTSVDRQRMQSATVAEGAGGVVNELLIQMQSFDEVPLGLRLRNWWRDRLNRFLPFEHQLQRHGAPASNILVIGATNRADQLDPALLRPGRFDRVFHFDLPSRTARKELVDYFVERRAHDPALNRDAVRDDIAAQTMGYTPASLERLFDEALLVALRDGRGALTMPDIHRARMEVEIGLPRGADYPDEERRTIATHEAGHAVTAYLAGKARRLEVLSIIKRKDALGLLAHRDEYERFTRTKSEIQS
ncbi:MAG: AAA family ATPase, partial [Acidimicrobiia bacterium]